jgi:hypothetical protein
MKPSTLFGGSDFGGAGSFLGGGLCDIAVWWLAFTNYGVTMVV